MAQNVQLADISARTGPSLHAPPGRLRRVWPARALVVLLAAALAAGALMPDPVLGDARRLVASTAYVAQREARSALILHDERAAGNLAVSSGPYTVIYPPGHGEEARLVLAAMETYAPRVFHDLGATPPARLAAILTADGPELNDALGLSGIPPVGAYWSGLLWFQAPSAWMGADANARWTPDSDFGREFLRDGPVVHELAHAALDRRLSHPVATWFDEGLAQYEDARLTGFEWREPGNDFDQRLYTYEELTESFGRLPNEALAYREAYALVKALAAADGGRGLGEALDLVSRGAGVDEAARTVLGEDYAAWRGGAAWR